MQGHAAQRIAERLRAAGLTDEQIVRVWAAAKAEASKVSQGKSEAFCAWVLDRRVTCPDGSTGTHVFVIIRDGWLVTTMLRGRNQDPRNLRCDKVVMAPVNC